MSPRAQIPSHRKPRSSKMNKALRAGMTGGVMGTIALTAAAAPASAADKNAPAETVEMPTLSSDIATSSQQAVDSLEKSALQYELQDAQEAAIAEAKAQAKETKEKAEAKARAEAKKKAEEAREKAEAMEARADRSSDRADLGLGDGSGSSVEVPSGSGSVSSVISFLKAQIGKSYVLGASGPSAYDCSSLTQAAFKQVGVDLPRVSQDQSTTGTQVGLDSLQPGDILYWGGAGSAYHVGVYIGDGKFIGAQNSSTGVVERPLSYDQPTGAVRVL
ncbi:C40 family peptidase [Streptomyces sp. HNM0574]|uniref:C40 family peptidase n=1 Tax=Streptomyces sp. HNM0574 TaxID=2714954 RepID=UPI00146A7E14|nr:C40 family peptidase [Streptomyces sp. HNM0574]NLU70306.1 C40 family peptidase [Streptomyces sp. HNM0574]